MRNGYCHVLPIERFPPYTFRLSSAGLFAPCSINPNFFGVVCWMISPLDGSTPYYLFAPDTFVLSYSTSTITVGGARGAYAALYTP